MKNKLLNALVVLEEFVASFFFIIGSIVCIIGVFMRYVMNHPLIWTNEVFETLMVTAIFIGFGIALKEDHHIKVDIVYEKMSTKVKRIFDIISNVLGAGFSIFLTFMGFQMVSVSRMQGSISIDVGIPLWITYLAMPVGMGLLSFYFILNSYRALRGREIYEEESIDEKIQNLF